MASLGQLVVEITTDLSNFNKGLVDAEKKVRDTTGKISELTNKIGAGLTVAGAAIVGAFALMVKSSVDYSDEIYEVSQRTGIATETLSKLKYVAEQTESSFEGLTTGLRLLSRNIFEAYNGGAKANEVFRQLGIAVKDEVTGKMLSAENALLQIADKFKGLDDATAKSALALQLFGRGGSALVPVLNLGSEGIKSLSDQAERLGIVLTTANAKSIDQFGDNMKSLKSSIGGLWLNLTQLLIPALDSLIKKVTDIVVSVREWSEAHPALSKLITELTLVLGLLALAIGPIIIIANQFLQTILLLKLALPALTLNVGALTTAFGFLWAALWPVAAVFAGWKLGEWIEKNSSKIQEFMLRMKSMVSNTFSTFGKSGPVFGLDENNEVPARSPGSPSSTTAATPTPSSTELDTTLSKLQQHSEAIKILNEQYISGKITADQYLVSARTLWQDGIDLATQTKGILDQELNLELLLTDTQTQKNLLNQNFMSEKITLAEQSLDLLDRETNSERQRLEVMQQGISVVQEYYQVKAQLTNKDIADQTASMQAATTLLQTISSMHQTVWTGIFGMINTGIKTFSASFSQAISGMILGTMTAAQAFKQLGTQMITAIVNFFVEWAVQAALAMVLSATVGTATMAIATGLAAAWFPAALYASIATLGAADAAGAAGMASATASGLAMFAGLKAATAVPMAEGGRGTVTKPTLFLAGEKGDEDFAFAPKSKGGLEGQGNTFDIDINIESPIIKSDMDIEELAEQLGENIQRKLKRVG